MNKWSKIISFSILVILGAWLIIGAFSPIIFVKSDFWILLIYGAIAIILAFVILFNKNEDKIESIKYNKKGGKKK